MKSESFSEVIRLASVFSVAFPLLAYLVKFRSASRPIHIIGLLAIVSAVSDTLASVFFSHNTSTVLLFNSYYVVSFALLAFFYFSVLQEKMGRTTVTIGIVVYLIAFVLLTVSYQPFTEYQTFVWTLTGMIVLVLSVYYFLHIFGMHTPMNNSALLWINSGILYYFSLNLFLFVMSSYVLTKLEPQISLLIWSFHNINNILKNVLIGFGITSYTRSGAEVNTL
jgi:hypothetical protein